MSKRIKKAIRDFSSNILVSLLAGIISMLVAILANLSVLGSTQGRSIYYTVAFVAFLVLATMLISSSKRGPTKVAALKNSLINAFCGAIESSPLNPKTTSEGKQ